MTGEQTILSKIVSPLLNEGSLTDAMFGLAIVATVLGYVIDPLHPILGAGLLLAWYSLNGAESYSKTYNMRKNGLYNTVERTDDISEGYTVLFILGYEVARSKDFEVDEKELDEDSEVESVLESQKAKQ